MERWNSIYLGYNEDVETIVNKDYVMVFIIAAALFIY